MVDGLEKGYRWQITLNQYVGYITIQGDDLDFCPHNLVIFICFSILCICWQMVDAWGGWNLFQGLLRTLKQVASKHGVSIATVAVKYILDQVNLVDWFLLSPEFDVLIAIKSHSHVTLDKAWYISFHFASCQTCSLL